MTIRAARQLALTNAPIRLVSPTPIPIDQVEGLGDALDDAAANARGLRIEASATTFIGTSGTTNPATITLTAVRLGGLTGAVTWTVIAGSATLTGTGDSRTVTGSTVSGYSVTIRARVATGGINHDAQITLTKLGALSAQETINLTNQVTGQLASGNVSGLGALALLNTVNLNTQVTGALNGLTQVTNLGNLAYVNGLAANQIGAGTLAVGVQYAGIINVAQLNAGEMTVINGQAIFSLGAENTGLRMRRPGGITGNPGNYVATLLSVWDTHSGAQDVWPVQSTGWNRPRAAQFSGFTNGGTWNFSHPVVQVLGNATTGSIAVVLNVSTNRPNAVAVQVSNTAANTQANLSGPGYAVNAVSGGYLPFTGVHEGAIDPGSLAETGDIVVDVETLHADSIIDTFHRFERASEAAQRGAIGVLTQARPFGEHIPAAYIWPGLTDGELNYDPSFDAVRDAYDWALAAAVGEGQINVCGRGGDLARGDLIVCSDMPGKGMRQPDDIVRGNTVARSREDVHFDHPDDVRLVPCVYLCG